MKTGTKIIAGVGLGLAAYEAGKSIYYKYLSNRARKNALKMDIHNYNKFNATSDDSIVDTIRKLYDEKHIVYMQSTKHCGKIVPCVLVKDNFTNLDINRFYIPIGNDKKAIYRQLLGDIIDPDKLKLSGGATSCIVQMAPGYGLFDESEGLENMITDKDGFISVAVIVFDEQLSDCGLSAKDIDAIIHHEYWHCYCQDGYIEKILKNDPSIKTSAGGIVNCPKEEIECDAFAFVNTSAAPNVCKIIDRYTKVDGFTKMVAKLKVLTEGRK